MILSAAWSTDKPPVSTASGIDEKYGREARLASSQRSVRHSQARSFFQRLMRAGAKNVWMSMFENVQGIDNPGQQLMGHFSWCYLFNDAVTKSQEQTDGDVKPSNDGGGSVAPQGHANIFEWMNAQVLTEPERPQQQNGRRR